MSQLVAIAIKKRQVLLSYICKMVGYHEAEDVFQEGLISLSKSPKDGFTDDDGKERFVTAIMRNKCIDVMRKRKTDSKNALFLSIDREDLEVTTENLETEYIWRERDNKIEQVLNKAISKIGNEEQREVIMLHYMEGYKFREIAEQKNISQMDVKNLNYRAISRLKSIIPQPVYKSFGYTILALILSINCLMAQKMDPEFVPLYTEFREYADKFNVKLDTTKLLGIYFSDVQRLAGEPNWRGVVITGIDQQKYILINRAKWNQNHYLVNEQVFFHELGHTLLNRNHSLSRLSIMYPDDTLPDYDEKKSEYMHELFFPRS